MAIKYCSKCGHGNPSMSQGVATKFCGKCGYSMDVMSTFGTKTTAKKHRESQPAESRRRRWKRDEDDFEEEEYEDGEYADELDPEEATAALRKSMSLDMSDLQGPMKAGDIVGMGGTGFDRPKGKSGYDANKFRSESQTSKNNPDIIGGNG